MAASVHRQIYKLPLQMPLNITLVDAKSFSTWLNAGRESCPPVIVCSILGSSLAVATNALSAHFFLWHTSVREYYTVRVPALLQNAKVPPQNEQLTVAIPNWKLKWQSLFPISVTRLRCFAPVRTVPCSCTEFAKPILVNRPSTDFRSDKSNDTAPRWV